MGVNPVPDNILSRRGGSRTARPPNPTVIPSLPPFFPRRACPSNTGSATHPPPVVLAHAGTHPSLSVIPPQSPPPCPPPLPLSSRMRGPIPPYPLFPRRARPRENGGGNPSPSRCPRACGDPSLPIRYSPAEPAPVKTGAATHPPPVVLTDAGTHPSLSVIPPQSLPPQTQGREPIPHSHSHPSFLPAPHTCHSERSEAEPRNLAALPLVVLADAGTHPSFPRCHYYENRPFRGYKSLPP